ncbi:probable LRR receptor-like serine/threonine-protein kinase At1g56140 [Selaginella moellendorffii]|uniref:probable LRR receptor-like serine/threonine-protein kinase At1g56140 n=1 Tax=Selaginella moellendorffii TaxID=88036 RepID=UPI000D1C89E0|nr:probable LRR receptor-like serine/threonine-protein kinase At1g56140 [Selaginella moellendorffii]|eukprot:XP_024517011.1 probable LRR receptor-like serine/threonine-protein kinase At1g56140 [Selaginella moellendorffii]
MARALMFVALQWMFLDSLLAASTAEISAIRDIASALGVPATVWNTSTDPCSGRWRGISCCNAQRVNSTCCSSIYSPFESTLCPDSSSANSSTIVGVSLDSNSIMRVLSGSLPDSVCNLTSLVTLDLNNNNLQGPIPRCIGIRLTRLKKLGMAGGAGNLGTIPEELGSLSSLEQLYLDNTNLTGPIPSSFGGMTSLQQLDIRYNRLSGRIPLELGRLSNLVELGIQVNSLEGGIEAVASLTRLETLRAFNNHFSGNLSLSIFRNLSSLRVLNLKLNNFTGGIPELDERFVNLTHLDLSFNQFSGGIPGSLVRLPSLTHLFLGHNNLSGAIPSSPPPALQVLDVSHNSLSGSLPNLPQQLQVDFSFNSLNSVSSSAGGNGQGYFNCIAPGLSCNRSLPGRSTSFAVRVGSSEDLTNRDGTLFRSDGFARNSTGLHYLEADRNWALELSSEFSSTVTFPATISGVPPEDNSSLYQTMRWSSSYLAYHGGNLAPGTYSVSLYFCETVFTNASYRAMDVVVQGEVIARQLDVVREVGPRTAYKITRNATVTDGSLSIEFIFTGPDRYINPNIFRLAPQSGAMVSAISVRSFDHVDSLGSNSSRTWKVAVAASVSAAAAAIAVIIIVAIFFCKRSRKNFRAKSFSIYSDTVGIKVYSYKELYEATDGFNPTKKLGQGGFGSVYVGNLQDQTLVAVKQLLHQTQQGREAFRKEIRILSSVQHRNLVAVRGYCLEAEHPMLVCDYMRNGSLDHFLHGSRGFLTWNQRRKIAIDTAFGLAYLHDESKHRIIHCDLKPPNILLDDDLMPRIADFGMARLYEEGKSHVTATKMGGTIGYLAPEYAMHYQLSDKADVYSYGVVLLEIISGRRAIDSAAPREEVVLVDFAQSLASISTLELVTLLDKKLEGEGGEISVAEVVDMARVAVLCTLENPLLRPRMRAVWLMLKGTMEIPDIPAMLDTRYNAVRALMSAYERSQATSDCAEAVLLSPR